MSPFHGATPFRVIQSVTDAQPWTTLHLRPPASLQKKDHNTAASNMVSLPQAVAVARSRSSAAVPPTLSGDCENNKISPRRRARSHDEVANSPTARPVTPCGQPSESGSVPPSSCGQANIRIRRSHHGSLLLQSPACAGHAARMRQIFEDASREQQTPQPASHLLYPQLPNVSRKASPPLARNGSAHSRFQQTPPTRRPQSRCVSTTSFRASGHDAQPSYVGLSEQSSESWSDDSGYLIARSRNSTSALSFVPNDRISEWLTSVSTPDWDQDGSEEEQDHIRTEFCQHFSAEFSEEASGRTQQSPKRRRPVRIKPLDPFIDQEYTYTETGSLPFQSFSPVHDIMANARPTFSTRRPTTPVPSNNQVLSSNDEMQYMPLSPNICVERGPSRYHSSRNRQVVNRISPTKTRHTLAKENTAPICLDNAEGDRGLEAPCKVGVGTRFQHPRHGARQGLGRWARYVD